jgi:ankyrin repeat protein
MNAKLNLVKEIIKLNADFLIQNDEGENALFISAKLGNSDIFGMLIMKMLNDELENKLIGRLKMKSTDVFKMVNNQNEDLLMTAIKSKSKD